MKTLDKNGIAKNTLLIFTSDNGSPRMDGTNMDGGNDSILKYGHNPSYIFRGKKADIWEGGHHIPFFARWPGKIKPGTKTNEVVCLTDLFATCAAILGDKLPDSAGEDSYNVLPAFLGEKLPDPERPLVFSSGGVDALSIRLGKWVFIEGQGDRGYGEMVRGKSFPEPKVGDPPAQLYNLDEDLGESNNLYEERPEIVERMKQKLEEIKAAETF